MSTFFLVQMIDTYVEIPYSTTKSTNLEAIRIRLLKYNAPLGTMKLQLLNAAKDTVLAESNSLLCNYSDESDYVGSSEILNMSWIKFDFVGEAVVASTQYYLRLVPDSTYFAGVQIETDLTPWTEDTGYYKTPRSEAPVKLFKGDTLMTAVGSKPAIDSDEKYYDDGSDIWLNYDASADQLYMFTANTVFLSTLIDYPKPTNIIDSTFETAKGRNFPKYPHKTVQTFGRDFG